MLDGAGEVTTPPSDRGELLNPPQHPTSASGVPSRRETGENDATYEAKPLLDEGDEDG